MGRAATLNGNGRAVLPPQVLEPMRRYRQPEPPRRPPARTALRVLGWILLAILVVASGIGGGLYLYTHETLKAIGAHSKQNIAASKDKNLHPIVAPSAPATALVIGYDTRKGADAAVGQESRSDTIMLIRADPTNDTISTLSFPRDLQVPIYCKGSNTPVVTDRINSAWSRCGSQGTLDTVAHLTGVPINYLITVNFHGFKLLVNKLHGVYMTVDHRYYNSVGGPGGYAKINLEPGYQKLDGQEALDFVRFRHTDSDIYRLARQQLFLEALKDRLASSFSLLEIPQVIGAVKGNVEVVKPGAGAPSITEIQSYAGLGYRLPGGHLFRNQIENLLDCGFMNAEVCTSPTDIANAVQTFQHPDVTLPGRANAVALGKKPRERRVKALKPSQISTLVLNGTTTLGLARDTSYQLAVAGYRTRELPPNGTLAANAPTPGAIANTVYFDTVQPNAKRAAAQLAVTLGPHTNVKPIPPDISTYAQAAGDPLTVVVVGSAFDGKIEPPQEHLSPTPTKQPPAVRATGDVTSLLHANRPHVPFPVYTATVVGTSSGLTNQEPLRVFKPAVGKHEVVLTFYTAPGNVYWQVIQTDWVDAPILRKPTSKYSLGNGHKLNLYTNGGHIHLAVLRTARASYWVVNTLRDELSNETMLAIAKGLRPLGK
ncbi:MAG TPA: LCP family protein [Gaiellaceae bacterium]|nr:LCP family protein [Gaiellaceae bacterium]